MFFIPFFVAAFQELLGRADNRGWSEKCRFGEFKCTFRVFSDHLLDFWGPSSWGPKLHFSDIEMHFLEFAGSWVLYGASTIDKIQAKSLTQRFH